MRKLLMDTLCQQGPLSNLYLYVGYSHCEGEGVYSIIEKSIKDWAFMIYNWVCIWRNCYIDD